MKVIDRYIASVVAASTLVALLVVVGLDLFFTVIDQLNSVGTGGYTLGVMLQYVLLSAPQACYELFPMAALMGSLMGMGTLASHSELTAMRASGMSVWRITLAVLQIGVLMLVVAMVVGEWLAPAAEQYRQHLRAAAAGQGMSFLGGEGLWVRNQNRFINVRRVLDPDSLADLTVYELDDKEQLATTTHATHAQFSDGHWVLYGVQQSTFGKDRVTTLHVGSQAWPLLVTPDLLANVTVEPKYMSTSDLSQLVDYLDRNGLDARHYRFAFWKRVMTPVSSLIMLFVAVPFVFGSLRSIGTGQRIFIGVLVGFGFYILSQVAGQMGLVYGLPPLLTMLFPNLVFLLLGIRAVRRL
jgi:lipopolysaccharide export system permease protein